MAIISYPINVGARNWIWWWLNVNCRFCKKKFLKLQTWRCSETLRLCLTDFRYRKSMPQRNIEQRETAVLLVSGFCMQLEAFTDMIQNLWFPKRLSKKCTFFVRRHTLILIADLLNWIGIYFTKYRPKRKINRQIGLYVKFCPLC